MAIASSTIPAHVTTAIEMSQYFLAQNHGDVDAAAAEMAALLDRNAQLYEAMVDGLLRLAVQEKACRYVTGLGQRGRKAPSPLDG
jgi:hypothetical protein